MELVCPTLHDDVLNQQLSVLIMSERRTVNFIKNQNHSHKLLTNFVTASQVLGMLIGVSASELLGTWECMTIVTKRLKINKPDRI